ncbi:SET domain-containing protein [Lentithecium fluviatile CBS 122367]|uniref:SET domain-containing protein n=1 Tax=Lentithecium fluviatile CBS 122367 TaxID=1168545 RepID=A0A6G1IWN7_9PLEO|nr:SET domain-containing protein [Lentithecium fluviatile CBS 122367]
MSQEAKQAKPSPYYLARSKNCIGDGLFAGVNFKGGETIIALKRPLLASLESERLKDTCANCFVWTEESSIGSRLYVKEGTTVQTCAGCKRFRYCSKACQKAAWNRGHKHECKNLRSVSDKEIPKAVLGCMELLVRRKHKLIDDDTWVMLQALETHIDDFVQNGKYPGIELMAMGTSQFSATQNTFTKEFVAAMYARILSNALTLITPTFDPLGIMIDPLLCHMNHSCDPNAYVIMDGPQVQIRTLKDTKKDEEIYISYIDPTNPFARRQNELRARWFFACKCSKCQNGTETQEDEWAIAPKDLNAGFKKMADMWLDANPDLASDPANYVDDSTDGRRVAALQGEVFKLHEDAQTADPEEAIRHIESALDLCRQSGLWRIHRQPVPALRDDLIVNALAAGKYELAWAHCVKRHQSVLPKLYPQPYHPVRVIQTWQMAMLAQYLASTGIEVKPGVDMAVIAGVLINMVNEAAKTSHGPENAFSKSVQEKFKEVETEILGKFGSRDVMDNAVKMQEKKLIEMGDLVEF